MNSVLQPEFFVEISEELAKEKGIKNAGWVKVSSKRGEVLAKAYVTKRIRPLLVDGRPIHIVGIPIHWGFVGAARKASPPTCSRPLWATRTSRRLNTRRSASISSPPPGRWHRR